MLHWGIRLQKGTNLVPLFNVQEGFGRLKRSLEVEILVSKISLYKLCIGIKEKMAILE